MVRGWARAEAMRTDGGTLAQGGARQGEPLLPGLGDSGLRDEAAEQVAVPEAEGAYGEIPALPGRAPTARHGAHASGGADVISNDSPVREKRTLDSMSGERKRGQGGD